MSNFADGANAVTTSLNSQNSAMIENEKYLNSIDGRLKVFKATFQELSQTLIDNEVVKAIINIGTGLLKILNIGNGLLVGIPLLIAGMITLVGLAKTLGTTLLFKKHKSIICWYYTACSNSLEQL